MEQINLYREKIRKLLTPYYENEARKLHRVIDRIFNQYYGGINGRDMDEYYGIGTDVLTGIWKKDIYDFSRGDFDGYVYQSLRIAFIDEFKRQNRDKRTAKVFSFDENTGKAVKISVPDIRLDAPLKDGELTTQGDLLRSDFNLEEMLLQKEDQEERIEHYLHSLPKTARRIIEMRMKDLAVCEIKRKLGLTEREYRMFLNSARMNENLVLFAKVSERQFREDYKMEDMIPIDVTDQYRMDKFPLGSLLDDMRDGKINKKHILQRKAFQWTERQKNKYLTRVLNGQPIPEIVICEQTVNGKKKSHLIDGLQRLSYSELFRADGIVVKSDGAEFYEIPYKEYKYDQKGNVLLDEDGDALFEEKVFNVIGKKFSEFPQFLKERFQKFNINVTTYFNCTDDQIAYHIRNYNNQEGMNKNQYEFTGMDVHVAENIKRLSDEHPFFKDCCGKYTAKNKAKGDLDKVVAESIMAAHFINDWKKEVKDSFAFVNRNAKEYMFDSLKNSLDRLSVIVDREVKHMFTIVNSPVWFAVFEKFKSLKIPDAGFRDFIKYVSDSLERPEIDQKLFADLYKSRNTRDKAVVLGKVDGLTKLMYEFFHIGEDRAGEHAQKEDVQEYDTEAFLSELVGIDRETLSEDLPLYHDTLDDLEKNAIRDGSRLLEDRNRLSLLAMVAYSYKEDTDLDEWITVFAENNNTYFTDQKKNYLYMKMDLNRFAERKNRSSA